MDPYSTGYQPIPSNNNQPYNGQSPNDPNQSNSYQVPYNNQPYNAQANPYNQPYSQPYSQPQQPYSQPYSQQPYSQQPYNDPYVQQKQTPQGPEKPVVIQVETEPDYPHPYSQMINNVESRLRFVRKVLSIVTFQLMIVTAICAFCMFPQSIADYLGSYDGQWVFWVALSFEIILLIVLFLVRKYTPINFAVLIMFTIATGFMVGCAVSQYTVPSVFEAFLITVLTTVCLVGYVYFTKSDFRMLYPAILCLSIVILWWCIFTFLWAPWYYLYDDNQPSILYDIICLFGIIIFVLYILYDTSRLMHRYDESEYILGAVNLYLDILNLFLCLLGLSGKARN